MDYEIIELPRHLDRRGNLSVVESNIQVPFDIKRTFFIYDVPGGEGRAGHAHYTLYEFVIAVSGSFTIIVDDGFEKREILLNKPYQGFLLKPGTWSHLVDFSSGAVALVLCSDFYKEADYIRDYSKFKELKQSGKL